MSGIKTLTRVVAGGTVALVLVLHAAPRVYGEDLVEEGEVALVEGRPEEGNLAEVADPEMNRRLTYLRAVRDIAWRPKAEPFSGTLPTDLVAWLKDPLAINPPFSESDDDPATTATILLQDRRLRELETSTPQDRSISLLHTWRVKSPRLGRAIDASLRKYDSIYGLERSYEDVIQAKADAVAARGRARAAALTALVALIVVMLLLFRALPKQAQSGA